MARGQEGGPQAPPFGLIIVEAVKVYFHFNSSAATITMDYLSSHARATYNQHICQKSHTMARIHEDDHREWVSVSQRGGAMLVGEVLPIMRRDVHKIASEVALPT